MHNAKVHGSATQEEYPCPGAQGLRRSQLPADARLFEEGFAEGSWPKISDSPRGDIRHLYQRLQPGNDLKHIGKRISCKGRHPSIRPAASLMLLSLQVFLLSFHTSH